MMKEYVQSKGYSRVTTLIYCHKILDIPDIIPRFWNKNS